MFVFSVLSKDCSDSVMLFVVNCSVELAGDWEFDDCDFSSLVVSIVKLNVLSGSLPSLLKFPAESQNALLPTEMTPSLVLFGIGVKVAV